jgi:hypothetical protein
MRQRLNGFAANGSEARSGNCRFGARADIGPRAGNEFRYWSFDAPRAPQTGGPSQQIVSQRGGLLALRLQETFARASIDQPVQARVDWKTMTLRRKMMIARWLGVAHHAHRHPHARRARP